MPTITRQYGMRTPAEIGDYAMNARMTTALCLGLWLWLSAAAPAGETEVDWQDGKWVPLAQPVEGTAAGETAIVRRHLDNKKYKAAVKAAKKFLKRYPTDPLREEVLNLAGDAEMARKRYWPAYTWYEKQIEAFPTGKRLERALTREMDIARAFLAGKKRKLLKMFPVSAVSEGIEILHKITERTPKTVRAELALLAIGDHYFDKGKWEDASDGYDAYLGMFPKSVRAPYAELRAADAMRRSYQGKDWDETPLLDAEQRYKAFTRRYPAQAAKANVAKIVEELRSQRAAKNYEVARFYLETGKHKAAKYYLDLVTQDFADTPWAERAEAKLAGITTPRNKTKDGPPKPKTKTDRSDGKEPEK